MKRILKQQANGDNFFDALSAAPIAGIKGIPILLVSKDNVPESVLNYINTQDITKTYVIGSSSTISDTVVNKFMVERMLHL